MTRSKLLYPILFALALLVTAGPAQSEDVDCRDCHAQGASAADFSKVYAHPETHHPVGIIYPIGIRADRNFREPNGRSGDVAFFDKNGNGQADGDEVQLFGREPTATITCSSCHIEHGKGTLVGKAPAGTYLRVSVEGSALCSTCHNQ